VGGRPIKRWCNKNINDDSDVTYKHSLKINAWGAITAEGQYGFHTFRENMNADKYVSILAGNFMPYYDKEMLFQFDNDPKHKSRKAKSFIERNNINTVNFPPYSPDLNPIENVWSLIKRKLYKSRYNTIEEFNQDIINEWNSVSLEVIKAIVGSMRKRLELVIKNNGNHIDY
jgi:hypothetical protein